MRKFEEIIREQEGFIKENDKKYHLLGNLRLFAIAIALYTFFMVIDYEKGVSYIGVGLIALISFGILVKKHNEIKGQLAYAKGLVIINKKYIDRIQGKWDEFEDIGEEYLDHAHPYALDLDIVGKHSLFQMINTTGTWHGRQALAKMLLHPDKKLQEIMKRQQAVRELGNKLQVCQRMEYASKKKYTEEKVPESFLGYCKQEREARQEEKWVYWMPYFTVGLLGIGYTMKSLPLLIGGLALVMVQCFMVLKVLGPRSKVVDEFRQIEYFLINYLGVIEVLEDETFSSPELIRFKNVLFEGRYSAQEGIEKIEKISSAMNLTRHPLLAIPLNVLWMWNYKRLLEVEEWQSKYGSYLEEWLEAIGQVEALMSLAVLLHLDNKMQFPIFEEESSILHAKEMGHPLIKQEKRVVNSVDLDEQIWIITGSNMSGKTTFLRTIGINLVLAYCGAPVCAKTLVCSKFKIYTSMRIRDDLKEGLSTFYAELMRIKQIIDASKDEGDIIFLIDEIFRGTNSIDRIEGAQSVLKSLNHKRAIGALTTHDLELCALAQESRINNYHFTECYEKNKITFDYELKQGPSTSTNAKYLMKMVGIEV